MLDYPVSTHYYTRIFACLLILMLPAGAAGQSNGAPQMRISVVDGDTLALTRQHGAVRQRELVRLIGVDAPEGGQRPWGQRAKRYLRSVLKKHRSRIRLEFDVERHDRHGRLLAYVRLTDGTLLNERMIRSGYALAYTVPPNVKYADRFAAAQQKARQRRAGLWKYDAFNETPHLWRQKHPRQ